MITEQPKLVKVKLRWEFNPSPYPFVEKSGRVRRGNYCRACGAPLKDPISIRRGYGRRCWNDIPVKVVFEIPPAEKDL